MRTKNDFLIQKWYMDCVSYSGETFIGNYAVLHWKHINIQYSHYLLFDENQLLTSTSFKPNPSPEIDKSIIHWKPAKLEIEGQWNALAVPLEKEIFKDEKGSIIWRCLQPLSEVGIRIGDKKRLIGLGYVEKIESTIKPWQFPFDKIQWGRFHSDTKYLVWINFSGIVNKSYLLFNDLLTDGCIIDESQIKDNTGKPLLTLSENRILRKGPLISTVFSKLPGINKIIPDKILSTNECKYLSKGFLNNENKITGSGWAIHETIKF
jgi:hypothetical protein